MLKIVCDTNTLISGFLFDGLERRLLIKIAEREIICFISEEILVEFAAVISREKFGLTNQQQAIILSALTEITELVKPAEKIWAVQRDPDDNKVIECAVEANAQGIVSGDRDLLDLKEIRNIPILSTRQFLTKIQT